MSKTKVEYFKKCANFGLKAEDDGSQMILNGEDTNRTRYNNGVLEMIGYSQTKTNRQLLRVERATQFLVWDERVERLYH